MDLRNLLISNEIDRVLAGTYIERIKKLYPDHEVFVKQSDPDYVYFREKVGESTFGVKPNIFTVSITKDVKVHYTQLYKLT